ncbi:hypothetical protein I3842_08G124400 [Carya illinoinensis]|uniref:Uncharacterized protein n=1 Tax=Carya illinoinensis TaxID=32201 RepID=A0A922EF80_CARIL|nr:hypothetical protein I3842_08G124400 [Carya illinoinensis]
MTLGKNFLNFQNLKKRRNRGFCDDRDFVVQWCKAFFCNFFKFNMVGSYLLFLAVV